LPGKSQLRRAVLSPVLPVDREVSGREQRITVFFAFALFNKDLHIFAVDVRDFKARDFADP